MKVMRRSRWLARLAAMLVVGVASLVAAASAPARAGIVFQSHTVASWVGVPPKAPVPVADQPVLRG